MRDSQSKEIHGHVYNVTQLGTKQGLKILSRVSKAPNGNILALGDEDVDYVCDTFAKHTSVDMADKSPQLSAIFELHFRGKYNALVEWLAFCMEVNFSNFSEGQNDSPDEGV
jgi:hypothetical protein